MQDFLKDRPVLNPEGATIIAPAPGPKAESSTGPFTRIVRESAATPAARPASAAPAGKPGAAPAKPAADSAHTSSVKTVVENGRITKILVTCSCGKLTEIACQY